ncbi:MAG: hypothetical protein R3B45_06155 [Bdellovibrionota bacterium]
MSKYEWLILQLFALVWVTACGQNAEFAGQIDARKTASKTEEQKNEDTAPQGNTEDSTVKVSEPVKKDPEVIEKEVVGEPEPVTEESLAKKCLGTEVKTYTQTITFSEPEKSCDWNQNGNLDIKQAVVTARYRQDQALSMPEGAVLCSMSMDSLADGTDQGQYMYYDDEIFLTFNDYILAASQSNAKYFETTKDGFLIYDWKKLVGTTYSQTPDPYCIGKAEGLGRCEIPKTETKGVMKVEFDDKIIQKIAVASGANQGDGSAPTSVDLNKFKFSFITTGDNDTKIDCKHSKFEFKVATKYVLYK